MAQTAQQHMRDATHENADQAAWIAAAKASNYRVEDGVVWGGIAGMLFPLPALPGFASLPESSRLLAFRGVVQHVTYRIGQTAIGNVVEAVAAGLTEGKLPSVKNNDAFESLYTSNIADRVLAAMTKKAEAEGKPKPKMADIARDVIADTATKYRDQLFDSVVAAGKANITRLAKAGVTPRASKTDKAIEI